MSVTIIIIVVTSIISFIALNNERLMDKLIFYPPAVTENGEYYRFISCGFIHADMFHLIFNMVSFYSFGIGLIEPAFREFFGSSSGLIYLLFYLLSLVAALIPTYLKNRHNTSYRSLGASGAVSAIIFAGIMISPLMELGIVLLPFRFPGFIFGFVYLLITAYLDKRGGGHINHSAHLWGAVFGIVFIIIIAKVFADIDLFSQFVENVRGYVKNKFG